MAGRGKQRKGTAQGAKGRGQGTTRRALLDRLKRAGPQEAQDLARFLGLTAMAVRQHLYALETEGIVASAEASRPVGRPAKLWQLTTAAAPFFPDGHAELTQELLDAMQTAFGAAGLERMIAARTESQLASYRALLGAERSLKRRAEALARVRAEEGYMAEVRPAGRGVYLLIENHCPICAAARACRGFCRGELDLFRQALGPDVQVERVDHLLSGARRCSYRLKRVAAV